MFASGKTAAVASAGPAEPDAQFNNVTMLLHGDGTNGAQNNTFLDSSSNNFTITRNGNTTQGSFSPYGSNWSNYFDGSGDYLLFADNAGLEIGTNSFTFEAWINLTAYSSAYGSPAQYVATVGAKEGTNGSVSYRLVVVGTASSYTALHWQTYSNDSTSVTTSASYAFALNTWYHVAAVRNGTTVTLYVNGTSIGSGTDATNSQNTSAPFRVGSIGYTNFEYYFPGYISNLRLLNGTAVYTSNFTPSTTPLTAITNTAILTCQSNRFVDNSTNNAAVTVYGNSSVQRFNPFGASTAYSTSVIGGSGYFDGTGDYLTAPDNTAFEFGSGNFTIEAWAYPLDGGFQMLVAKSPDNSATGWQFFASGDELNFFASTGGSWNVGFFSSGAPIVRNAWNHLAVTRSGSTWTIWVNGVSQATATSSITINNNSLPVAIGAFTNASYFSYGYTADVRIIKGTALYTSNFTPPTAPLTAITNTSLLTSFTNGAIFDNAMMNDLETVGNAQISTSVVKYGTGSLAFDGSGDWLIMPYGPTQNFGTGAFTIEGWFYLNSLAASYYVPAGTWGSGTSDEWLIQIQNNGSIRFLTTSGSTFYSASITTATWYHIAVVRSGSTVTIYVNGTSVGSYTCTNSLGSTAKTLYIGTQAGTWDWNGYIDDFRITNGYARYTTTFTPPTAALSDTGPY